MIYEEEEQSLVVDQAIDTLEKMSDILDRCANKPENYNTDFAYYLQQMSWEMYKYSNQLKFFHNDTSIREAL